MNDLLRSHVTRVGFSLQLTRPQVAALVYMDVMLQANGSLREQMNGDSIDLARNARTQNNQLLNHLIVPMRGLYDRGLIVFLEPDQGTVDRRRYRDTHAFTKAGRLVVELLKESGIWREIADQLAWTEPPPAIGDTPDAEIAYLRERVTKLQNELEDQRSATRKAQRGWDAEVGKVQDLRRDLFSLRSRVRNLIDLDGLRKVIEPDGGAGDL